jgi:hypothetical protein
LLTRLLVTPADPFAPVAGMTTPEAVVVATGVLRWGALPVTAVPDPAEAETTAGATADGPVAARSRSAVVMETPAISAARVQFDVRRKRRSPSWRTEPAAVIPAGSALPAAGAIVISTFLSGTGGDVLLGSMRPGPCEAHESTMCALTSAAVVPRWASSHRFHMDACVG